jgi:guanylate kinase
MPECVTIFILPPSRVELERRLRDRKTDSDSVIERRLRDALGDMQHWDEFDHAIINDDLDTSVRQLQHVLDGDAGESSTDNGDLRSRIAGIVA